MARPLDQFSASGRIRSGPMIAAPDAGAMGAPAAALGNVGRGLGIASDVLQQRAMENDIAWATQTQSTFSRELDDWKQNNKDREDFGEAYRTFADKRIQELSRDAKSGNAAKDFQRRSTAIVDREYSTALQIGERNRLANFETTAAGATEAATATFRSRYQDDPQLARELVQFDLNTIIASAETAFGGKSKQFTDKLKSDAIANVILGVTEADPEYAKELLNSYPLDERSREVLLNKIERAAKDRDETSLFNFQKAIYTNIEDASEGISPLNPLDPGVLSLFTPDQQERIRFDHSVAGGTIAKYAEVKSWNWVEQQNSLSSIPVEGDPVAREVRANVAKLVQKSRDQQTTNPAGWQMANDPEFQSIDRKLESVAPALRTQAKAAILNRMVALQGPAPIEASPEERKRYLNLPTGLQNVLTLDQAKLRAQTFNNVPPNQLTQMVADFEAEFADPKLAAMAWNDMQNLPEGEGKLRMGIRVATAIQNEQVRNNFLTAINSKEAVRTEDKKSSFDVEIDGRDEFTRFVAGMSTNGQRNEELVEFRESIVRYAMHISATEGIKTSAAIDKALKRVITDNYGIMDINGSSVPVYRYPSGGIAYDDAEIERIRNGINDTISKIDVSMIAIDTGQFPLAPRLPGDQTEANEYMRRLVKSAGTVVVEPDGKSVTIYLKGEGDNDFPFQLRKKNGAPFRINFDYAAIVGREMTVRATGTPVEKEDQRRKEYLESLRRIGVSEEDMRRKIRINPFDPSQNRKP